MVLLEGLKSMPIKDSPDAKPVMDLNTALSTFAESNVLI